MAKHSERISRPMRLLLPVAFSAGLLAVWWLATATEAINPIVLPPPGEVAAALTREPADLARHTWVTLLETVSGFAIAAVLGVAGGALIASSRLVEAALYPVLVAFNAIPKVALAPLLVVWLGFSQQPKIVMVVMVCFFPIVLATATGLATTPVDLVELARSLTASWWQTMVKVRLPAAMPQVFIGFKTAMPLAVIGAVLGELVGAVEGLGFVVNTSGATADLALAFAAIFILAVMSVVLYYALVAAERLFLPWVVETTSRH
jgi:NitT/TauT family transport system permease protein